MKKFLFLLAIALVNANLLSYGATPPVPTSTDNLLKRYKEQQTQQQQQPQKNQTNKPASQSQQTKQQPQTQKPQQTTAAPKQTGPLSINKLEEKLEQAVSLIKEKNYAKAEQILHPLTIWLTDSTEYHILLLDTLKGINDAQYQMEIERAFAVKSALLRDKALFYYGVALMENKKYEEAARNFILVVQSQPKSKLGFDAYTRLQMLGFTQKVQFNYLEDVEK